MSDSQTSGRTVFKGPFDDPVSARLIGKIADGDVEAFNEWLELTKKRPGESHPR